MKRILFLVLYALMPLGLSYAADVIPQVQAESAGSASEEPRALVDVSRPPPPTVDDLVLLLRSYKPDVARVTQLLSDTNAALPSTDDLAVLAVALHKKALAADELQEADRRNEFLVQAITYARQVPKADPTGLGGLLRLQSELVGNSATLQGVTAQLDDALLLAAEIEASGQNFGHLMGLYQKIVSDYVHLGDMAKARLSMAKMDAIFRRMASKGRKNLQIPHWADLVESARGFLLTHEGKLEDAERAYAASLRQNEDSIRLNPQRQTQAGQTGWAPPDVRLQRQADSNRILVALIYLQQERLNEAELLLREVLKRSLARDGRNSVLVGRALTALSLVFTNRGRYAEAVVLAEWSARTLEEAGLSNKSPPRINSNLTLANALVPVGRATEAVALLDKVRSNLSEDVRLEEGFGHGSLLSIRAYVLTKRFDEALRDGDSLVKFNAKNFGADHYYTAEARAYRAIALQRLGRLEEARRELEQSVAILVDPSKVVGKQQTSIARTNRLKLVLNEYLNVLVGNNGKRAEKDTAEAFRVSDVARWQSVQKAVSGSALRSAAGTPELGAQIKKVQDADDEMQAVYKNLISQRSAPPEKQLPTVIAAMEARIATLKNEQQRDLVEIRRKFPQYDALVNPRPADFATARKVLRPTEALLSIYVTPVGSYVWATGPDGNLRFHFSAQSPAWIADKVKHLRDSVDLTTGISPDRMRFDLVAGSALYQELLAPVEAAWDKADTLLVVANESLGQIPFSMLPTRTAPLGPMDDGLALSQFRHVPWLARKVAVAYLPSVSALVTLRALPATQAQRAPFIGFGDPDFGAGGNGNATRGIAVSRTRNLAVQHAPVWDENKTTADAVPDTPVAVATTDEQPLLMQLPDTRDEITAIATALSADLKTDTFFGTQANRQNVMGADLKHRRIVAFATHGLVSGDLPGLDQPALALSPAAGKPIADGLLKLEDILKLSLDADLVVLSACNTAAADGTGAEAVSGLGRGFFYAGARAVLATHWPVETVSARQLVTHLFERYSQDGKLSRAQALRKAMVQLIDTEVAVDARGTPSNAYAHPAFWAPYALYGDPGR
jgi:CHAT domain-containing protein